jgi:hypothetical protein
VWSSAATSFWGAISTNVPLAASGDTRAGYQPARHIRALVKN